MPGRQSGRLALEKLVRKQLFAVLAAVIIVSGCSRSSVEKSSLFRPDPMLEERKEKDREFKTGSDSPLPPEERAPFQGLSYFDINPALRFRVKLNRYSTPQNVRLGTNTGEIRPALRYGYFEFQVEGKNCRLQVYRVEDTNSGGAASLFVPFRDATSGKDTYAAGRYIDLKENTSGYYDLDFNRAYNPYCAYNGNFSCPVPPAENTLPVSIRAGEKAYPRIHAP